MKKSELKNYIRENIISTLSEDTEAEIEKTKELTSAIKDLESAKKEAGIEEANIGLADLEEVGYTDGDKAVAMHFNHDVVGINNDVDFQSYRKGFIQGVNDATIGFSLNENATPRGEDFTYDYEDIGQFYLEGFGKEHTLNNDQLRMLGKKITDNLYGGDIGKAYDAVVNPNKNLYDIKEDEVEIPSSTMLKINNSVKTAPSAAKAMLDFYNQMAEKENIDFSKNAKFKIAIDKLTDLAGDKVETPVTEDEDKEPSKSDIKKNKGLAKAAEELALLTREMKSLAKKYSKAEGEEKEKLVADLKKKTKLKKELEAIIDK